MTHDQIIEAKGISEIAERLGVPAVNVRMWKWRQRIPRAAWAELIDAYPDVTLEMLKAGQGDAPGASRADAA